MNTASLPRPSQQRIFANQSADKTLSVLVVDDHLEERQRLRLLLEELYGDQLSVELCETGLSAIELLRRNRFDLVMIDQLLPDMDGLELVSEIADFVDETAIIMMSSSSGDRVAADAMKCGARDYLGKRDLDAQDLEQAIVAAIRTARIEASNTAMIRQMRETNQEMDRFVRTVSHGMQANLSQLQRSMGTLKELCARELAPQARSDGGSALLSQIARVERDLRQSQELVGNLAELTRLLDN